MDLTPDLPSERQVVESYGGGRFRVSGTAYEGSILVRAERTLAWPVADFAAVTPETLDPLFEAGEGVVEVLLIGCGPKMALIPEALSTALRARGVAADAMDTGAACRTYNVLLSEERRVAAALIAVD